MVVVEGAAHCSSNAGQKREMSVGQQVTEGRLDGIELLAELSDEEREELSHKCRWLKFVKGEQVVDKDSADRDVYFVADGSVQVVNYSLSGREIAFARLPAGSYFGELSAIDGLPRSAAVVAAEKCLLATLSPEAFHDLIRRRTEIALQLLQRLGGIIRSCDERIMDLSTMGAMQRVYLQILRLAEQSPVNPEAWQIRSMPTQKAIAAMASTTRETAARAIGQLTGTGIVERKGRMVHIRDKEALERLAGALDAEVPIEFSR
jgi:CRP/FNR family cyclic AMP-dependent transcriptional regulator